MLKRKSKENNEYMRAKKYGCNGKCYTSTYMCPNAETCPETRLKEFRASLIACVIISFSPLILIACIILCIICALL